MSSGKTPSLWKFGGLTPLRLGMQVWKNIAADEVSVRSTSLAYYFVLAVFPAMLFVLSVFGFFATAGSHLQEALFANLARMLPGSASDLIQKTLREVTVASGGGKAAIGIIGALWSASSGISAVMQSLNVAYKVQETRPMWKQRAVAVGLTLAVAVLVLVAFGLILFGGKAAGFLGRHGFGSAVVIAWQIVQWPLVLAFMFAAFAGIYYFAPNLDKPAWHWITPGSGLGLVLWLVASLGFRVYLNFFNSYSKTYGSIGAVIILLLWLYITGFSIMVGGEINSEIGRAAETQQKYEEQQQRVERGLDQLKAA
jgi:membrane protein